MFELFISFLIVLSIVYCSGLVLSSLICKKDSIQFNLFETGLLGIFFYVFISLIVHFFFPLNQITNFIIVIFFILFSIIFYKKKSFEEIKEIKIPIFILLLTVIIMTIKYKPNEDYGFYHLPYIINLISEKVIFGLSNLQPQYSWNSTWLNFSSSLYLPLIGLKGTQLSNSLLYFLFIGFILSKILFEKKRNNFSFFFLISLLFYTIIKYSRISAHGFDLPANLFLLLSFYYFIILYESKFKNSEKNLILFLFFSIFSITIKLNTIPVVLILAITLINLFFNKYNFKKIFLPLIFLSFFIIFWLTQQYIYSACFFPFLEFTCFKNAYWYSPSLNEGISSLTGAINKSYWQYSGTLSEIEYVKNFNWVPTWFNRNKIEIFEHLAAIILPLLILLLLNLKNISNNIRNFNFSNNKFLNYYILLFIFVGLLLWFLKSPVYRFGMPYIFLATVFSIYLLIKYFFKKIEFKKSLFLIICLTFIFNIAKNTIRITKLNDQKTVWPEIINIEYSTKKIGEFKINYPDSKIVSTQHNLCWSIPFLCDINKGKNIKIEKKRNYYFILN